MLSVLLPILALSAGAVVPEENDLVWVVENLSIDEYAEGLFSVQATGCFNSSSSGILIPERTVLLPAPTTGEVSIRVIPDGIQSLGSAPDLALSVLSQREETFVAAPLSLLPSDWGELQERGTFRRAGYVSVRLNPVIVRDSELLAASSLRVVLEHDHSSPAEVIPGHEGEIMEAVLGTSCVWREPPGRLAASPFWGKPWARIQVDTAGVYQVTGEMIPEAVGMPSGSFSMITGRGRMISETDPVSDTFLPLPVPILIQDGGDGTFDQTDRVLFFGRGLSWWGEPQGDHFNNRYDSLNTYWLTWGGLGGPFMETLDGSVTGAPSGGADYENRLHFEENQTLAPNTSAFDDMYGWHRIASSSTGNYTFSIPAPAGAGTMRFFSYLNRDITGIPNAHISLSVNGIHAADTTVNKKDEILLEFPVSDLKPTGNTLTLQVDINTASTQLYTGWFEVFPETEFRSWSTQCQVPLGREFPSGERRLINWAENLDSESFICLVQSDTSVVHIVPPTGRDFEVPVPEGWTRPVMWILPGGDYLEPIAVSSASPGRILGTLSSGSTAYLFPDFFASDMPLFQRGRPDVLFISLSEIYDEFNGGIRDPGAIRAFFGHTVNNWNEPLDQLVLTGTGHWDPRGILTEMPCFIDIIIVSFLGTTPVCSDTRFTALDGSRLPQGAVSRIPVDSRTELQLVAQRSLDYSYPVEECGTWQSVILGAADDERSQYSENECNHTNSAEWIFTDLLPDRFIPLKNYLIFWDWNSNWKKPQGREAFISSWSKGALIAFFLGHGSLDQLADEGMLYIEDVNSLECGKRLPWAFFGSCDVGMFQIPANSSIAEEVVLSSGGGAIVSSGATGHSGAGANANFLSTIILFLLEDDEFTMGESQWLGMLKHVSSIGNNEKYAVFGDGSLFLALPDSNISFQEPELFTSQICQVQGDLEEEGLVMVTAWESASPDSYYTYIDGKLITYLSQPGIFYRGLAQAVPEFSAEMFVPEVAATGDMARIRFFYPGENGGVFDSSYPLSLSYGVGSPGDSVGPEMELWISGFRGTENPSVSGEVVFESVLSDDSGINLLPYPGNQLALYIDESPVDISEYFTYQPGSATQGQIIYSLPALQPGVHTLRLRAADNLSNISWEEMTYHLLENSSPVISQLFVYPSPAVEVMSFNWIQSSPGSVDIAIYAVSGRKIMEMGNLIGSSGYNQHSWYLTDTDGDQVASGTYIYVVSAGESIITGVTTIAP